MFTKHYEISHTSKLINKTVPTSATLLCRSFRLDALEQIHENTEHKTTE
jgi:hypothetical protein